ncbi:hypothetical protein [Daejeonella sp.]|uniref:hypothetical protein n=1 Tax=Daejeonella sp. TaxID=2805397 RepID=UPI00273120AD|nr:hypothetical protein [Daejeonella sp.]MDP2413199.1 hypothetical protein [Daejeonella sp.]
MHKLKLFSVFYKSTLSLSIAFATLVAAIGGRLGFITVFGIAFMTGGWILSLFYKEQTRKNEYFYYQNMGITKTALVIFCILLNVLIGSFLILFDRA